jgi:thiol:disulfide interchange protein DsbD
MFRIATALALLLVASGAAQPPEFPADPFEKIDDKPSPLPKAFLKRATVDLTVTPAKAKRGETVVVKLTVTPKANAWTYPAFPKDREQFSRNSIDLPKPAELVYITKPADPKVEWKLKPRDDAKPDGPKDEYSTGPVTWEFNAVVAPKAKPGKVEVAVPDAVLQACDANNCVNASGKQLPVANFEILDGESTAVNRADLALALAALEGKPPVPVGPGPDRGPTTPPPPAPGPHAGKADTRKQAKPLDEYVAELKQLEASVVDATEGGQGGTAKDAGFWSFVFTAAAWGLISLVTPCVFPMIPITVSIFMKQAHGSFRERLKLASVYSLTIIIVLGLSAFALLKFMAILSVHPVTNLLLGALFFVLALSLFGMYEIALPNSLQKRLQAKQAKGGTVGTIFGALAFTVISFTCVAPFLGGFAGISAGAGPDAGGSMIALPTAREVAGGLAFATAFAAPFFVLALLPGMMKALPKSGGWLDSVKVVMGFLELAAALVFLRTAELGILSTPRYFTFDTVLCGWVVITAATGLYLLGVFRLPHDEESSSIGAPRLLFALFFLGLALHLAPALVKGSDGKPQRPNSVVYAWVESFLLPDVIEEGWGTDLSAAVARSKQSGKPVFIDFTGVTCKNCKYNEQNVFSKPAIALELEKFERVQLYTDWVPESAYVTAPEFRAAKAEGEANRDFQERVFKDIALPLYVVVVPQPDGKLKWTAKYDEGKINQPAKFAQFLKDAATRK